MGQGEKGNEEEGRMKQVTSRILHILISDAYSQSNAPSHCITSHLLCYYLMCKSNSQPNPHLTSIPKDVQPFGSAE